MQGGVSQAQAETLVRPLNGVLRLGVLQGLSFVGGVLTQALKPLLAYLCYRTAEHVPFVHRLFPQPVSSGR